jgi:hypothetical protein
MLKILDVNVLETVVPLTATGWKIMESWLGTTNLAFEAAIMSLLIFEICKGVLNMYGT